MYFQSDKKNIKLQYAELTITNSLTLLYFLLCFLSRSWGNKRSSAITCEGEAVELLYGLGVER